MRITPTLPRLLTAVIALSLMTGACAAGPALADAKTFVTRLYAGYAKPDPPDLLGARASMVFSPQLVRLIHLDAAQAQGDAGALDYDPICGCQDFALSNVDVSIEPQPNGAAGAVVHFDNAGQHKTIRFDLVAAGGHWRIADVHDDHVASLVEFLKQHTAKAPAAR